MCRHADGNVRRHVCRHVRKTEREKTNPCPLGAALLGSTTACHAQGIVTADIVKADIVMAYIVMVNIVMACVVVIYVVVVYIVMAYIAKA